MKTSIRLYVLFAVLYSAHLMVRRFGADDCVGGFIWACMTWLQALMGVNLWESTR